MGFTASEVEGIVRSAGRSLPTVARAKLRKMLRAVGEMEFATTSATPLRKLCAAGVDYGWSELSRGSGEELRSQTGARARLDMRRHLLRKLEWITRPCLELEWISFVFATNALGLSAASDARSQEPSFLGERPGHRLFLLFKRFPVLARLWSVAIFQWDANIVEVLERIATDRAAISRFFFHANAIGRIKNLRLGLSDPHGGGRSVTLIEFGGGRLVYKPRSGKSESSWFELLTWMNRQGFQPKLRAARVLDRKRYCWMEYVEAASCKSRAGVRRFYERLGGIIAAAYLLKAVDCHRQNLIAAGEYPLLVDVDALWHVSVLTKTQTPAELLYRTGFFPTSKRRSLQSRSSVLGWGTAGSHLPRVGGRPAVASHYVTEIIAGFSRGWSCLVGRPGRRSFFVKHVRRIRSRPRRWIYQATERYASILRASVGPFALQSEPARQALIAGLCSRSSVTPAVIRAETKALRQLDLPYFLRTTAERMPADSRVVPTELIDAIRNTVLSVRARPE
jgi:lantibiotic modifying enzyme